VIPIPDQTQPAFYIFNYQGGGYIILAADRRIEPVLAYSETGKFQKSGLLPDGLATWLTKNYDNVKLLRQHKELIAPAIVTTQWTELLTAEPPVAVTKPTTQTAFKIPPDDPCTGYSNTHTVGPLLVTAWGQGCFYNDYCPAGNASCSHVPTGCAATAMAQIMYYWKFPTSFLWATMPTTVGSPATASLMQQVGAAVGTSYSDTESSAPTQNIGSALRDTYGYKSVEYGDYNYDVVRANLNAGEPIVLRGFTDHSYSGILWWKVEHGAGEGHGWICDGYQDMTYNDCTTSGTYSMLHMNWGWNEYGIPTNGNGWYRENVWTVVQQNQTFNFQYMKQMVYNIHP